MNTNELRADINGIQEGLNSLRDVLAEKIRREAKPTGDMAMIQMYARDLEKLNKHIGSLSQIEEEVSEILLGNFQNDPDFAHRDDAGMRLLVIKVSQGMLNQSLLTLSDARKSQFVQMGEKFAIELPDGSKFETDLVGPGSKLRERGMIRRFYESERILAGDTVALKEISPNEWRLLSGRTKEGEEALLTPHGLILQEIEAAARDRENDPEYRAALTEISREEM